MNTAEFLASLESSAAVGLDELDYDSFWDHSATQDMEEEVEEVVAEEEEVVEVTGASTKVLRCRTQNYSHKVDIALCDAWCAISMYGCNDRNGSNQDHVLGENYRPLQLLR
jgi:hypothetical protein